ncbi:hypothetical protein HOE22_07335 [Candidatus Woesearchaeota archaeon]|jgi:hypothetical protein|nr:hypothetical protein [Candidatus Woesearchaeota archaeon]MBT4731727.1 hypothetical protein [Candidatus Woesearchaeota archaeon]MBT7557146.1 hypothetical protein [Candidatus Woesearchaeota archaeon]
MKYKLIDKFNNVVNTVDLESGVGISGARTYFIGVKRIYGSEFDKIWKVITEDHWNKKLKSLHQKSSYKWWNEDREITDDELKF